MVGIGDRPQRAIFEDVSPVLSMASMLPEGQAATEAIGPFVATRTGAAGGVHDGVV